MNIVLFMSGLAAGVIVALGVVAYWLRGWSVR